MFQSLLELVDEPALPSELDYPEPLIHRYFPSKGPFVIGIDKAAAVYVRNRYSLERNMELAFMVSINLGVDYH